MFIRFLYVSCLTYIRKISQHNILMSSNNHLKEEFQDTKGVIRIRIYRRRTDNTIAKRKRTNNDQQNIHIKLKIE